MRILHGEWILKITGPAKRLGPITVGIENAPARDRAFANTLIKLLELWLNKPSGRPR